MRKPCTRFFSLSRVTSAGAIMRSCSPCWSLLLLLLALALPLAARAQETYTSPVFQVTLQHPAGWRRIECYEEKYGGADGFFQLSALDGRGWTIEGACELQAGHHLRPYGSSPQLERWQVRGQEACVIWPSQDQAEDMMGQAALLVRYPQPVQIRGSVYYYFILEADKNHLQEIAQTLHFVGPSEGSTYTGLDMRHPKRWSLGVRRVEGSGPQETYTSPVFHVTLQYPVGWRQIEGYEERYGGDDGAEGFFQLSAMSGEGKTIEEACEWEAANFTYGFLPQIQWWKVEGQDACLIWPSEDQEIMRRGQAALIVRYFKPVQLRGNVCHYLILWADKYHIEGMGKTLHFVEPSEGTYTGPDLHHTKRLILKLRGTDEAT